MKGNFSFLAVMVLGSATWLWAENIVFPAGSGFVDVTSPPYNAPRDGVGDATAAINRALKEHIGTGRVVFLPNGTYLISNSLIFPDQANGNLPSRLTVQGQSQAGTIIRLKNKASGFSNAASPKAMLVTGHDVAQCFGNNVRNLTLNNGAGNPGAIGLRYYANNTGTASNLTIQSGDGQGAIGLDLHWQSENGPLLVKNTTIEGFGIGVNAGSCQNSQTLENLTLRGQKQYGIKTSGGVLSIRNLVSVNSVPAIHNTGVMTVIGADLSGGAADQTAIINASSLYARNLSARGYRRGIENGGGTKVGLEALSAGEWSSHEQIGLHAGGKGMLHLPIKETPDMIWDPASEWQPVNHPGDGTDATVAIQAAIDAGKTTVYFKPGKYQVKGVVRVRGAVRSLYGFQSELDVWKGGGFVVEDGTAPTVVFENFGGGYRDAFFVTHASARTVAIKNVINWGVKKNPGSGDLFLEDICANPWTWFEFHGGKVWARQLNPENEGTHILNKGSNLWILGMKTERGGTLIETREGGRTEVCGFFAYTTTDPKSLPMFLVHESEFSATGAETAYGKPFAVFVEETRSGVKKTLLPAALPNACGNGRILPFFVSKSVTTSLMPRPAGPSGKAFRDWGLLEFFDLTGRFRPGMAKPEP